MPHALSTSLIVKFSAVLVPVIFLVTLLGSGLAVFSQQEKLERELRENSIAILESHGPALAETLWAVDSVNVNRLVQAIGSSRDISCVTVQDNWSGETFAWPEPGCLEGIPGEEIVAQPLEWEDKQTGLVSASLARERMEEKFYQQVEDDIVRFSLLVVAILAAVFFVFRLIIARPLQLLSRSMQMADEAGHRQPVHFSSRDELGQVVQTYNDMLAEIENHNDAMQAANAALGQEKKQVERALGELNAAHAELNKANRSIQDSIRYASRIQSSLLPDQRHVQDLFHDLIIEWSPRDIVGGDFYWIGRFENRSVVAIIDCTGHGVPGAFMTAIVASILDRILHEHCYDDPARVLSLMNRMVKRTLRQENEASLSDDGLDAAICVIDMDNCILRYAGSHIPLLHQTADGVNRIVADRESLGYRSSRADFRFRNHDIQFAAGDSFFLYSDGLVEQIGGPKKILFGRRRLVSLLEQHSGSDLVTKKARIMEALAQYRGPREQPRDDVTLIGFTPLAPGSSINSLDPVWNI